MRSLAVISNNAFSIANFRGPLVKALIARGVRVFALAPDYDEKTWETVRALGAEPVRISLDRTGMRPLRDLGDMIRLARCLRRLRPDATFGYFAKPIIYGSLAARLAGVKRRFALVAGLGYVYIPDGPRLPFKRRVLRAMVDALYQAAFRACERVFFQNDEDIAQFTEARLIDPAKAIRLRGTGVDLERLSAAPAVQNPPTFLLMARLLREKGIREFVEAARVVRKSAPGARFIILGALDPNPGGIPRAEMEQWTRQGAVEWLGHVDDVRPWIAQSSVYVLPSYREGTPRSTQEAMAMARPVVTTDAVGCRETVVEGVNGFMVPIRDSTALAAAMKRFIDDPSLIASMGRESRRLAEERFDVHDINKVMLAAMNVGDPQPAVATVQEQMAAAER